MTRELLQDILRQSSFEPIEITLSSGEKRIVAYPELAGLGRTKMLLVSPDSDSPLTIVLDDIVSVE